MRILFIRPPASLRASGEERLEQITQVTNHRADSGHTRRSRTLRESVLSQLMGTLVVGGFGVNYPLTESTMELISRVLVLGVVILAGVLLFSPYEAFFEGLIAFAMFGGVVVGFLMYPRREVFYVRTTVRSIRPDRNQALEHDFLAVRVELARLWLLFVPTFLAVAFLVFFAAGGPTRFSFLNWIFLSRFAFIAPTLCLYPSLLVLVLLYAWNGERRVMRDAEACAARSVTFSSSAVGRIGRVSYLFMGEQGEYYAGDCMYFGSIYPSEVRTVVLHNVRKPELNKIAMGFLFHRLIVLGRGVTDMDEQTAASQRVLAETASLP